jgi:hypothetical protein
MISQFKNATWHIGILNFVIACRCKQWVIRCRLKNLENKSALMLYNGYRLCADHFEDSQFMNATTKDKLIHSALPSQFLMPNPPAPVTVKRRLPERCHLPEKRSRQSQTNSAKPPRTRTLVSSVWLFEKKMYQYRPSSRFWQKLKYTKTNLVMVQTQWF